MYILYPAGLNYQSRSGVITFPVGSTQQQAIIPIPKDNIYDPINKTISLAFGNATNSILSSTASIPIVIINTDPLPPIPPPPSSIDKETEGGNGGGGGISGVAIAVPVILILLIAIAGLIVFLVIRRRKNRKAQNNQIEMAEIHAKRQRLSLELMRRPFQNLEDVSLSYLSLCIYISISHSLHLFLFYPSIYLSLSSFLLSSYYSLLVSNWPKQLLQ